MTHGVPQDDLLSYAASAYAWRWQDPRHTVFPPDILKVIHAVRTEAARVLGSRSVDLDRWAREAPTRFIDAETATRAQVEAWLVELAWNDGPVVLTWHLEDVILVPWNVFATYWDAFWYPASDDVTVFPPSEAWALSCDHEGRFSWRARWGSTGRPTMK